MIPRLKGIIAHSQDTKLLGEDGEDTAIDWGTRPSPKAKPFGKDLSDTSTCCWGNKPNPKKDSIGIDVQSQCNNRLEKGGKGQSILIPLKAKPTGGVSRQSTIRCRKRSDPRKVYTHPTAGRCQTNGCGNTVDGYPIDHGGAAYTRYTGDNPNIWVIHSSQQETTKKAMDRDQTDGYRYLVHRPRSEGRDQPLFDGSTKNGQKSYICQHVVDRPPV